MSTEENLNRIVAKCRELLAYEETQEPDQWTKQCMAGWRATISAIEGLLSAESLIYSVQGDYDDSPTSWWVTKRSEVIEAQQNIIAAWPEELL